VNAYFCVSRQRLSLTGLLSPSTCYIWYFDTVGWVTGMAYSPLKTCVIFRTVGDETSGNQLTYVHLKTTWH